MGKSLQTAKIEELLATYKRYKWTYKNCDFDSEDMTTIEAELFWIKTFIKDLKWLLDDSKY